MPQEICELIIDFHFDTFPLQKVAKYEWYGSGMGVVWEWYGSGMGVVWEWYGSGMGVLRRFDTEEDDVCCVLSKRNMY